MFRLLFSLDGRIGRAAYLLIGVGTRLAALGMAALIEAGQDSGKPFRLAAFSGVLMLATAWISFAAAVKRLHDCDRRGWWLFMEVPVAWMLYGIFLLMFIGIDRSGLLAFAASSLILASGHGTPGPNRFGPPPRALFPTRPRPVQRQAAAPPPHPYACGPIRTRPRRVRHRMGALHLLILLAALFTSLYAMHRIDGIMSTSVLLAKSAAQHPE